MRIKLENTLNFAKKTRNQKNIQYIIIHYTGMQSARVSLNRLKDLKSKVSCHYFITRQGEILRMVEDNKVAWHAGKSRWRNKQNLNNQSIGIELQNKGHNLGYEKFSKIQIKSLVDILRKLKRKYNIKKKNILGHSDIAPLRKKDPGEKFPWELLSKKGLSIWYSNKREKSNYSNIKNRRDTFFKNLHKIGYRYFKINKYSKNDRLIIKAFQMRFLQKKVNVRITDKTLKISHLLANKS